MAGDEVEEIEPNECDLCGMVGLDSDGNQLHWTGDGESRACPIIRQSEQEAKDDLAFETRRDNEMFYGQ